MDGILITELTMLRLPSQSQSQPATLTSSIDKHTQLRLGIPQCSELTEQDTPVRDCAQGIDSHLLCQPLVKLVPPGSKGSHYRKTSHILSAMDTVAPALRKPNTILMEAC